MIRAWLAIVVMLALGAAAAWALRGDAGYVTVQYDVWIVETSLLGLVAGVAVALAAIVGALRLVAAGIRLPTSFKRWLDRRRGERARDSFESGLQRLIEGDWKRAEIELVRRASDHRASQLNYLGAARAAQRLGAEDRRDHYLKLALDSEFGSESAALVTRAELQLERGDYAKARETAVRLRELSSEHAYADELLLEAFAGQQDWQAVRGLLLEIAKPADKSSAAAAPRRADLLRQATLALIGQFEEQRQLDQVKALWDATPAELRREAPLRQRYAVALHRLNAEAEAAAVVADTLRHDWDGPLVQLYGELHSHDGVSRLATIEQWLAEYGERSELLVTAGRVCLQNKLWGKARSYLEAAVRLTPSPTTYRELARLCEQTQNPEEAARYYRLGLDLAT